MADSDVLEENLDKMSVLDLPDLVLAHIASWLSIKDFFNFKLTCQTFNQSTYSKEALKRFQITIGPFLNRKNKFLCSYLERLNCGHMISIHLKHLFDIKRSEETYKELFSVYLKDLKVLHVPDVSLLPLVSEWCHNIEVISITYQARLGAIISGACKPTDFSSFQKLKSIFFKAVEIKGIHLLAIVKLPTLTEFHFSEIHVHVEDETIVPLQECVTQAEHITKWHFNNCIIKSKHDFVHLHLPARVYSLHYLGKVSDCCLTYPTESLLELVTDTPLMPVIHKDKYYSNLQTLELTGFDFKAHSDLPSCSNIHKLKLQCTWNSVIFLEKLLYMRAEKFSHLSLDIWPYDYGLADVVSEFKNIKYLELVDSDFDATRSFVEMVKNCKPKSLLYVILVRNTEPVQKEYIHMQT